MERAELVLASGNPGKLRELAALLEPRGWRVRAQSEFNIEPPEETGQTFVENALIKARTAARASGLPALGDDSGLSVDALNGRPGIYSARFAGPGASDAANNALLLEQLADVPSERRGAAFHCVLVLMRHADDAAPIIACGRWHGRILEAPRGDGGFGYDPLFYDERVGASAAELGASEKARVSHRGQALRLLLEALLPGRRARPVAPDRAP